jgi:hypothetical protein
MNCPYRNDGKVTSTTPTLWCLGVWGDVVDYAVDASDLVYNP